MPVQGEGTRKLRGPHGEITWDTPGNHVGPTRNSRGPHGEIIIVHLNWFINNSEFIISLYISLDQSLIFLFFPWNRFLESQILLSQKTFALL